LFDLNFDLWKDIISDIASAHESLFSAMHQAAEEVQLTKELVGELRRKGELAVASHPWQISLRMDLLEDEIGGLIIYLAAEEELSVMEQIKADVASDHGFSLEAIEAFEMDGGLDMQEAILEELEESYGVSAEVTDDTKIVYELLIFDSQDIDDSLYNDLIWQEDVHN